MSGKIQNAAMAVDSERTPSIEPTVHKPFLMQGGKVRSADEAYTTLHSELSRAQKCNDSAIALWLRIPSDADQRSELMPIAIPISCRSPFQSDGDHRSNPLPISFGLG